MKDFDLRKYLSKNPLLTEGQFSWMTHDTDKQIGSEPQNTITVYMHDDKGNTWEERDYEGYGEFGGMDYYELLDKMNGGSGDRQAGIKLAFDDAAVAAGKVLFPALTEDPRYPNGHDFTQEAENDPNQSWYSPEEDEDEDEDYSWEDQYGDDDELDEVYTPGSGWTQDFDYDDMLAQGLKVSVDTPIEDLEKMFADFEDVNYHREGEPLSYAIDALKAGDRGEAKMYINKFHAEVKKTIADYSDEYFDVNEASMPKFDVETTKKIAQKVADAFTADDSDGLDLKYVVSPDVEESSFNLDVEAGPNTPGEDWKDENGFGIENYLGKYAGGSFYIKDGVVVNAAMRSAKVANVSPEGEVEMISSEDSRADLDAKEKANVFVREETKSNKMKKSELKEMIRQAMLAETAVEETGVYEAEGDEEEVDVEADAEETADAEVATDDVAVDDTETTDVEATAEISPEVKATQDALTAAIEAAKALGDQKLADQIGNSITFFTRTHVVGQDKVAENVDLFELRMLKNAGIKK